MDGRESLGPQRLRRETKSRLTGLSSYDSFSHKEWSKYRLKPQKYSSEEP